MGTWREYSCYLYAKATDVYVLEIQGTFLLDDDECPRGTVTDGNVRWEISEVLVVNEAIAKMLVEHDGDPTKWFECFGEPQDA